MTKHTCSAMQATARQLQHAGAQVAAQVRVQEPIHKLLLSCPMPT